ncbi:hypothetical protein ASE04_28945 [Rhizobium sp. Root708]|nr:hypothetical protein ASE04_28945 [Rhizobium sp. Root708]
MHRSDDILIYDAARPYRQRYDWSYKLLTVRVPRQLFVSRDISLERANGLIVAARSVYGTLVTSLLRDVDRLSI